MNPIIYIWKVAKRRKNTATLKTNVILIRESAEKLIKDKAKRNDTLLSKLKLWRDWMNSQNIFLMKFLIITQYLDTIEE